MNPAAAQAGASSGSIALDTEEGAPALPSRGAVSALVRAPITPVAFTGIAVLGWLATQDAGYDIRAWGPGGMLLLGLLLVGLVSVPNRGGALPRSTAVAMALLAGYCAWSFASALWAADPGAAWTEASRSTVYFVAFVLFAGWRQRPASAGVLLGGWVGVVAVLAGVIAVRVATTDNLPRLLPDGRLLEPAGYPNAAAALLLMAAFAAFAIASGSRVPRGLRAGAAGTTVLLADVALLALSRGSLIATPICLLVMLAAFPGRRRRVLTLLPIAAAVALAAPGILELTDTLATGQPPTTLDQAGTTALLIGLGAVAVALVVWLSGLVQARHPPSPALVRRANLAGALTAVVIGLAALVLVATQNPVDRLDSAWSSFKGGYADSSGSRLVSGLGSNRYDFYRVSLDAFGEAPIVGEGAGNFYETYLRKGRSSETPRYPHSLELRALSETGLVGAVLLFGALLAALPASLSAARGRGASPAGRAVATGALMATTYWVVHGSADWFFEYAGLGAAAFALLGLACSLDPARDRAAPRPKRHRPRRAVLIGSGVAAVLIAAVLFGLWSGDREVRRAGAVFATRSGEAYERLDRARTLDPLSDTPDAVAGSIAVRLGDYPRALQYFGQALERSPDDQYVRLLTGTVESALGRSAAADASLRRAVELAPRDRLAREALKVQRAGGTLDPIAVSQRVLARANGQR